MWLMKYYIKLQAKKVACSDKTSEKLLKKIFRKLKIEREENMNADNKKEK